MSHSIGADRILAERLRQMDVEGWTPEHDDVEHKNGELALAAWSYLTECAAFGGDPCGDEPPDGWPWDASWWKPSPDAVRNLEKAGALIAAEIDRLLRIEPDPKGSL